MATLYVRKDRALDGSDGPPDTSGLFYWFDGSDAAASDPDAVWTDETNADDKDISTVAYTTSAGGPTTNELYLEGTDAPSSGDTISSVDLWVFLGDGNVSTNVTVRVYTDSQGEALMTATGITETPGEWWTQAAMSLSAPSGGWTWAHVQALEMYFYTGSATRLEVAAAGVIVHTTAEGTKTTDPYRTIDDAANAVAAADTVYVGAGTYRETVTMDTSGSSGNQISFIADVDGSQTGDAGLVVISAFDDSNTASRTSCWDPDGRTFVTVRGFVMQGGTAAVVYDLNGAAQNYEGVIFEDCAFIAGPDNIDKGAIFNFNDGTTPTGDGLTIRRCVFQGGLHGLVLQWDGNATADQNLKVTIENCVFIGCSEAIDWDLITSNTFASGGVSINNCLIVGPTGVAVDNGTSTTYPVDVRNCLIVATSTALSKLTSNDGALTSDYNTTMGVVSNVTAGANDRSETSTALLGGIADFPLYRFLGWSPYKPFEPMRPNDDVDWTSLIGDANATDAPSDDLYGLPRPMSQAGTTQSVYYFDASDAGPTDNDAVWTNDSNLFDGSISTFATVSTAGTETTNELRGEGTNAPASGGAISSVETRIYNGTTAGTVVRHIYTDGEGELVGSPSYTGDDSWSGWTPLTEPSGGWTWAKVQALELIVYVTGSPSADEVGVVQLRVSHASQGADDRGAVEGRARPEQETTTVRTGSNAMRFEGAGYHDLLIPVAAQSTTISIYGRFDSNYTGSKPKIDVLNIPGVADQTDIMTGAANTWEEMTATFTPTEAGVCRLRITSQDTSATGQSFFEDLTVT